MLSLSVVTLFLIAAEVMVRTLEPVLTLSKDSDSFVWSEKLERISSGRLSGVRTIVLGDSQAMSGIVPADLGADAYNLALPSMQPEGLLALVPRIRRLPQLRRVIINISPYSLFQSDVTAPFQTYARAELLPRNPAILLQRPGLRAGRAGDSLDLALSVSQLYQAHRNGTLFASMEHRLNGVPLSLVRQNPRIVNKGAVDEFLSSRWQPGIEMARARARNLLLRGLLERGHGFWTWNDLVAPAPSRCAKRGTRLVAPPLGGWQPYGRRRESEESWRRLLLEFAQLGPEVHIVQVPFSSAWATTTNAPDAYRRLDVFLRQALLGLPGGLTRHVHLHPRRSDWDTGNAHLFHDWTHLSSCGAHLFTASLRAEIEKQSAPIQQ